MISFWKWAQIATSFGVLVQIWVMYPGFMVLFASVVGMFYFLSSIGTLYNSRIFIFIAFIFSVGVSLLMTLMIFKFMKNGFNFLDGSFDQRSDILLYPYLALILSITSIVVVIMHAVSWRWLIYGSE